FLDDVPANKIVDFEAAMLSYIRAEQSEFLSQVNETGDFNDEIAATMKKTLETFKSNNTW
ncbi:MAG: F0F1 ATP synthase subunit alpha, partial [Gammaproteobacteria bacterium]|nr:F0F1 ATP synthase subunit alpha [Gammaproteobacteria bacterium]